jgi:hypothetical protein
LNEKNKNRRKTIQIIQYNTNNTILANKQTNKHQTSVEMTRGRNKISTKHKQCKQKQPISANTTTQTTEMIQTTQNIVAQVE